MKPRRAYKLTLEIDADDKDSLMCELENFARRVDRDEVTDGVWGGYITGGIYVLTVDQSIGHDSYVKTLNEYLDAKATGAQP